jgi:hypothetical protein
MVWYGMVENVREAGGILSVTNSLIFIGLHPISPKKIRMKTKITGYQKTS